MTIDDGEFQMAFEALVSESTREIPYLLNKTAKDVCLRAAEFTPVADKGRIRALPQTLGGHARGSVWLRMIAQRTMIRFGHKSRNRRGKIIVGKRRYKGELKDKAYSFQALAKRTAKRLIGRRLAAVTFIKSSWLKAAAPFAPDGGIGAGVFSGRGRDGARGGATPAMPNVGDVVEASFWTSYHNSHKEGAVRIAEAALRAAIAFKTADMWQYVSQKMGELCQKYSSRAA